MSNPLQKKQLLPGLRCTTTRPPHGSRQRGGLRTLLLSTFLCLAVSAAVAQNGPPGSAPAASFDPLAHSPVVITPLSQPTLTPGVILLMELDGRFSQAVASGGGKAFASWFADDAVTLNNGRPPVIGHSAIAAQAQWDPKTYQLTWVPQGGQMGPSNDMGFTWGHYEGRSIDKNGQPVLTSGRYITMWKKLSDGNWKVVMDASADDAPPSECCSLPKP